MAEELFQRRCATHDPSTGDRMRLAELERSFVQEARITEAVLHATIEVAFIHVIDGTKGKITQAQRQDQIQVMNDAYHSIGIDFTYREEQVVEVDDANFFTMGHRSLRERQCKSQHQVLAPAKGLNFYTAGPAGGLLGWATFPFEMEGDPDMDGVLMLHSTLPGGNSAPFNLGATATHEVGHWLGLYHTFQDGCSANGDEVDDTPSHAGPNFGKPSAADQPHNLCSNEPSGAQCPIHNYMNYVDDDTMNEFTAGQKTRIWAQISMFRNELLTTGTPLEAAVSRSVYW